MLLNYLRSSLGKKFLMALSGMIFVGFVLMHMIGNLQIFLGAQALNHYAHILQTTPELVWGLRLVMVGALVTHVITAVLVTRENRLARGKAYAVQNKKDASLASRTMMLSGLVIFAFIVYHLMHYTLGMAHPQFFHYVDEMGRHDVYRMMVESFQVPGISLAYMIAMVFLCLHLSHSISAMFHTLGLSHPGNTHFLEKLGKLLTLLVFIGNNSMPLAVLLGVVQ